MSWYLILLHLVVKIKLTKYLVVGDNIQQCSIEVKVTLTLQQPQHFHEIFLEGSQLLFRTFS